MPSLRPFRALRYDETVAGPLADLVAPPYDVIDAAARRDLLARSPYNVVHLTLPESEAAAAAALGDWRRTGALREQEPALDAVREVAGREREDEHRRELEQADETEVEGLVVLGVDLPADRHVDHLQADERGQRRDPPAAVVTHAEGGTEEGSQGGGGTLLLTASDDRGDIHTPECTFAGDRCLLRGSRQASFHQSPSLSFRFGLAPSLSFRFVLARP